MLAIDADGHAQAPGEDVFASDPLHPAAVGRGIVARSEGRTQPSERAARGVLRQHAQRCFGSLA